MRGMDTLPFDGESMDRDAALAMLEELEAMTPADYEGLLAGGYTARAVVVGLVRTIARVAVLEEKLAALGEG